MRRSKLEHIIKGEIKEVLNEIDLDSTWGDTFGKEEGDRLAKKQHDLINDPVLMRARASRDKKNEPKPEPRINPDYKALKNAPKIKALERERAQLMRDMEQEAEPEGGPIANRYGRELDKIDSKIANLKESINENGAERFYKSAGLQLARQGKKGSPSYNTLMNLLNSTPLGSKLKDDEKQKVVGYAMNELEITESINENSFEPGKEVVVDIVGMTHAQQSKARRFNGEIGTVIGTQGNYVYVDLKGFKSPNIEFDKGDLKLAKSVNEEHPDHTSGLTIKGRGFDWKKPSLTSNPNIEDLKPKQKVKYKGKEGVIKKISNNKVFIEIYTSSGLEKIATASASSKGNMGGDFETISESVNEGEDHYSQYLEASAKAEELLNHPDMPSKYDNPQKGTIEYSIGKYQQEYSDAAQKHYSAYLKEKRTMDEGTCGYSKDGKPKNKPAGPHLITKADLRERILGIIKKHQ